LKESALERKEVESIADLLHGSLFMVSNRSRLIGIPPGYFDKVKTVPTLLGKV